MPNGSIIQNLNGKDSSKRDIARQLGVVYVLESSVEGAGAKVRVNARLSNARSDASERRRT